MPFSFEPPRPTPPKVKSFAEDFAAVFKDFPTVEATPEPSLHEPQKYTQLGNRPNGHMFEEAEVASRHPSAVPAPPPIKEDYLSSLTAKILPAPSPESDHAVTVFFGLLFTGNGFDPPLFHV